MIVLLVLAVPSTFSGILRRKLPTKLLGTRRLFLDEALLEGMSNVTPWENA